MSNRKLRILAIVAAVMVFLVVIQSQLSRPPVRVSYAGAQLVQGLEVSSIAGIEIGTGDKAFKLVREGKQFLAPSKQSYPAQTSKINELLTSCLDITTLELITSNPANFDELGVTEEKAADVVKFLDAGDKVITGVILGRQEPKTNTKYVRLVSGNNVYSVNKAPNVRDAVMDYIDKQIVNVERSDVASVTVTGPGNKYTLRTDPCDSDKIILDGLEQGKQLKQSDAGSVMSALSYFSFTDVKRQDSFREGELVFDRSYVAQLSNSIVYTLQLAGAQDKTYGKCSARYTRDAAEIARSKQEFEKKEAALLARDQAVNFTNKHEGWVYEIPQYKANNLTKKLADLVEDKKEEEKAQPAPTEDANQPGDEARKQTEQVRLDDANAAEPNSPEPSQPDQPQQ